MSLLKENEEKRSRKEERENRLRLRARELHDLCSVKALPSAFERGITSFDLMDAALKIDMSADEVMEWQKFMDSVGWIFATNGAVNWRNFRRSLRMWHIRELELSAKADRRGNSAEREAEKRKAAEKAKEAERVKAAAKPEAWLLCHERCRYGLTCGKCGAAPRYTIPPQLREHPIAPEECNGYEPKEGGAA